MIAMWNIMVGHVFALDTYTLHSIWTIRLWRICLLLSWLMTDISITQPFVSSKLNLKKHTKKEENPPPNLRFEMPQIQQILRFWSWLHNSQSSYNTFLLTLLLPLYDNIKVFIEYFIFLKIIVRFIRKYSITLFKSETLMCNKLKYLTSSWTSPILLDKNNLLLSISTKFWVWYNKKT